MHKGDRRVVARERTVVLDGFEDGRKLPQLLDSCRFEIPIPI